LDLVGNAPNFIIWGVFCFKNLAMKNNRAEFLLCAFFLMVSHLVHCQSKDVTDEKAQSRYLEDQFYIGIGYNILLDKPDNVVQRSLSYNLQAGFIKDIPLNQRRNFGIGLGMGYAVNSYYSNVVATNVDSNVSYEVMDESNFKRNKLETHAIEFPLEL